MSLVAFAQCHRQTAPRDDRTSTPPIPFVPDAGERTAPAGLVSAASSGVAVLAAESRLADPLPDGGLTGDATAGATYESTPLVDGAGRTLPQTEEKPSTDSPHFQHAMRLLFEAVRDDRPQHALPAFFPAVAYREVKAVAQPERDWQYRLVRNFARDVHDYHKQLGPNAESAQFLGVTVHEDRARWMKPGTEGNKLGYWRVLRSELRIRDGRERERKFELTSFISWRGEWYIVHVHGFE